VELHDCQPLKSKDYFAETPKKTGSRLGNRERFIARLERLVWITEPPESVSQHRSRSHPCVAGERIEPPMAIRIVNRNRRFQMLPGAMKSVLGESFAIIRGREQNNSRDEMSQKQQI
jgi:hypothetical protein